MIAVFNSDIFVSGELRRSELPYRLRSLLGRLVDHDVEIVIPMTTQMEFDAKQAHYSDEEQRAVRQAIATLRNYEPDQFDESYEVTVPKRTLDDLLKQQGIPYRLEEPTHEDFLEGHRRACMHLEAGSVTHEDDASDEMRDLVIWAMACRLSVEDETMLISVDGVHTGPSAIAEASDLNLTILKSPEEAMESLSTALFPIQQGIVAEAIAQHPGFFPSWKDNSASAISEVENTVGSDGNGGSTVFTATLSCLNGAGKAPKVTIEFLATFKASDACQYEARLNNETIQGRAETETFDPTALPTFEGRDPNEA